MLGQHLHHLEGLQVVDEDVWQPQLVDQLQVDRVERLRVQVAVVREVQLLKEGVRDPQPRLLPQHVEVRAERHGVLLKGSKRRDQIFIFIFFISPFFLGRPPRQSHRDYGHYVRGTTESEWVRDDLEKAAKCCLLNLKI